MNELENLLQHKWPVSRETERRQCDAPVPLKCGDGSVEGWCTDLSLGGIGFTAPAQFAPGEQVHVEFSIPDHTEQVVTSVVIRWTDGFHHGAEFLKPTAALLHELKLFVTAPVKKTKKKPPKQS